MYNELDKRYSGKDPTVMVISNAEIFIMAPACLLVFYAISKQKPWRYPAEIFISTFQLFGTISFAGSEILSGFENVPYGDPFYFWLCFVFANMIWIFFPVLSIYLSVNKITKCISDYQLLKSNKSK
eukprot:TRINITY_DN460_c0_g1_i2.p1 TRINITY_DN460_c0_g1~~TRINITY_DN460_c0_g1_i2.p1  ORF type:complete len:126 (+),score=22.82 TRINITY_DN460_c0_g1_i2:333-710(+)